MSDLMPVCHDCDNFYVGSECPFCRDENANKASASLELRRQRESFLFSTTPSIVGHSILSQIGVITGSVVLGTGFFSEFRSGISDVFGVQSTAFTNKLEEAQDAAFDRAYENARAVGANAMVGVDIKFQRFSDNLIAAIVIGTAVIIEKEVFP